MTLSIKNIVTIIFISVAFLACGKKEKELTPKQIQARADSIYRSKLDKLKRQAKEDLERRLPIELKPKVDSIRNISHNVEAVPVFPEDDHVPATIDSAATTTIKSNKPQPKDTVKK